MDSRRGGTCLQRHSEEEGDWEEKDKGRKRIRVGAIELGMWTQKRLRHVERDCHIMNEMNCDMRYDTIVLLGGGHVRHSDAILEMQGRYE